MPVTFTKTEIDGVLEVRVPVYRDERGYFTEVYVEEVWRTQGFSERFVQDNASLSAKGVLRGMHYQLAPHGMGKLVRVLQGSAFDVGVDLRLGSPTFGRWIGRELSAENGLAIYFPPGFAHGFVSLEDNTIFHYKCTSSYAPVAERSLLYCDPTVGITWPLEPTGISKKDLNAPPLEYAETNILYIPCAMPDLK